MVRLVCTCDMLVTLSNKEYTRCYVDLVSPGLTLVLTIYTVTK